MLSKPICRYCQTWIEFIEHYHGYSYGDYHCEFCGSNVVEFVSLMDTEKYDDQYRFLKFMKGEKCDNS